MKLRENGLWRLLALGGVTAAVLFVFTLRLAQLQIADGADYLEKQQRGDTKVQTLKAARGEILDRNGSPFAYNEAAYDIVFDKALMPKDRDNETILALIGLLEETGETWYDNLPLTLAADGSIAFAPDSEQAVSRLKTLVEINDYASAEDVFYWLCERYGLTDYGKSDALHIAAVRYEMERTGYSLESRYVFAHEISLETATRVRQLRSSLPGVDIEETARRVYVDGELAPHLVGRTGPIISDEMDSYLAKGYSLNDTVGREGIERAFEDTLRGTDGERLIQRDASYQVTGVTESNPAVPGNSVVLTIDKDLQRTALEALQKEIAYLNETAPAGKGKEADAGAVVAIDIKNSEVLAAVTWPSYDLSTYVQDYAENSANPLNPFWNRAFSGVYAPGSTFKPTVAVAGLSEKVITPESRVRCSGIYTFFKDYQPTCLSSHGLITVVDALRASCNIFFYDTGRQLGIETINRYAQALGLGVPAGIELSEASGTQCDPDTENPGDVLQAAIGQLDNGYTPLQLANYTATIARRGVRRKVTLVKSISSYYDYTDVIEQSETPVLSELDVPDEVWDTVFEGMIAATHATNGTSYRYLGDYPITVASKTGTPQTKEFPNSTYICFAPAEDPQIAIAVVIEKGWHGYTGAPVARAVLDAYFFPETEEETPAGEESASSVSEASSPAETADESAAAENTSQSSAPAGAFVGR